MTNRPTRYCLVLEGYVTSVLLAHAPCMHVTPHVVWHLKDEWRRLDRLGIQKELGLVVRGVLLLLLLLLLREEENCRDNISTRSKSLLLLQEA